MSNFVIQALRNESLTVHGDGQQTRSFQYISDLIDGLVLLMNSDVATPVNLGKIAISLHLFILIKRNICSTGNPSEMSMKTLADHVKRETNSMSTLTYLPAVQDDPQRRCPDITLAKRTLRWSPKIELAQGLVSTVQYFRRELNLSQLNN